jgi:hypothetical protein
MTWSSRAVAAAARFPVVIVTTGIAESPYVSGFFGEASDPGGITLRYGHPWTPAEAQVTTYPGEPPCELTTLVETSLGAEWWSISRRPAEPPAPGSARRHFTISGTLVRGQRPSARERARTRAMNQAIEDAGKRRIVASVDGVATAAYLAELPGLGALGLHIDGSPPLTALIVARAVAPETLSLGLTTDLTSLVRDGPAL